MTLKEIAQRIDAHLKRFQADPNINVFRDGKTTKPYFTTASFASGRFVGVLYVSYQGPSYLKKADALKYLEWLDAGNVGKHWNVVK